MKLSSVSCVLLAYNEEAVILDTIHKARAVLQQITDRYEVVVVCFEGSKDGTNRIIRDLAAQDPGVRQVMQRREEIGYGRAYALGIQATRYDWIFQSDADGQYRFEDLLRYYGDAVEGKVQVLHGYRAPRRDSLERVLFAWFYNIALKLIYRIPLRDIDSAFKLVDGKLARSIPLQAETGFAIAESLVRMRKQGAVFKQFPVTHLPRTSGEALSDKGIRNPLGLQLPNPRLIFGTLGEMWRMRKRLRN